MSTTALDRQIRPIYDALDTGSNKSAVVACNKLLKKHSKNDLIKALKALALVRMQKVEESLVICDEVLAAKPKDDPTLSAMMHVLRGLGRNNDAVKMFEEAFKQNPGSEELGVQTFYLNVRTGNWKSAQQIATKLHKQFHEERYVFWNAMSAVLQAKDSATPAAMKPILYKLAHRHLSSSPQLSYSSADRLHLHLSVLKQLELWDEVHRLLDTPAGKAICSASLACNDIRRSIWQERGLWTEESDLAEVRIREKKDRNWLEFLSILNATFSHVDFSRAEESPQNAIDERRSTCAQSITKTRELFTQISIEDGERDRSAHLALIELEHRSKGHNLTSDPSRLVELLQAYYRTFGAKACCFEDIKPYLILGKEDLVKWVSFLKSCNRTLDTAADLRRSITLHRLLRFHITPSELTKEKELERASEYTQLYVDSLHFGDNLPQTELQPADDFAILAAQTFVSAWYISRDEAPLFTAATFLEFALSKSKHAYQLRLLLIRVYHLLGAATLALDHYRALHIKQVQNDTLSHLILARASTFSLASTGDLTLSSECLESSQIYMSNSQETSDYIIRAFTGEKYSQIPDFIEFEERLENSLQRDLVKMEHVRMRIAHEAINSELVDMELIELKFIMDRLHHDNRDLDIILNFQPNCGLSFDSQTQPFKTAPALGWLRAFLKIYIRSFQHASDLDDALEDKLLIGDRPKRSNDPELSLPLKERLVARSEKELDQLTQDERLFFAYSAALADWVEPFHDYVRPTPGAVVDAVRQAESKAGTPKTLDVQATNGGTNGQQKKDDDRECPAIADTPQLVSTFFGQMLRRFHETLQHPFVCDTLHVVSLTQEALILLTVETMRFKPTSVVKVHKLGALAQTFKDLRTQASEALKEMSRELVKMSERDGNLERRKELADSCRALQESPAFETDRVANVARQVADARKKLLEGLGKGAAKVCQTHA